MRRVFAPFAKDKLSSASPRIGSAVAITEHVTWSVLGIAACGDFHALGPHELSVLYGTSLDH